MRSPVPLLPVRLLPWGTSHFAYNRGIGDLVAGREDGEEDREGNEAADDPERHLHAEDELFAGSGRQTSVTLVVLVLKVTRRQRH